jgi:hypothetical protein
VDDIETPTAVPSFHLILSPIFACGGGTFGVSSLLSSLGLATSEVFGTMAVRSIQDSSTPRLLVVIVDCWTKEGPAAEGGEADAVGLQDETLSISVPQVN